MLANGLLHVAVISEGFVVVFCHRTVWSLFKKTYGEDPCFFKKFFTKLDLLMSSKSISISSKIGVSPPHLPSSFPTFRVTSKPCNFRENSL